MTDASLTFKMVFTTMLVFTLFLSIEGAPTDLRKKTQKNNSDSDDFKGGENKGEHRLLDHRQNGTYNVRIDIEDVLVVAATSEQQHPAILSLLDPGLYLMLFYPILAEIENSEYEKPQEEQNPEQPSMVSEMIETKPLEQNSSATQPEGASEHGKPQEEQNQEQSLMVSETIEIKPLEQNSSATELEGASEHGKSQEGQNQEQSPAVLEIIETKPLEQNSPATKLEISSEHEKPQEGQNQEQSTAVLEMIKTKPLEQNSPAMKPEISSDHEKPQEAKNQERSPMGLEVITAGPFEKLFYELMVLSEDEKKPAINPTTKPVNLERSGLHYPEYLGPFLKRKQ